ncbi:hypothetical protein [Devosia sp.]|uniref:hypothetical protein n=1 Tax=Devosia sp. TaxID=1871048 RepID=UPI002AFF0A46|nr:hypothetical protein [Devosia sp.]
MRLVDDENAASEVDRGRTRYSNDRLRTKGRGGDDAASLSLLAAAKEVVVQGLRAIAAAQVPPDQDSSHGGPDTPVGGDIGR